MPRRALGHVRTMGVFFRELHALTRAGIALAPACRDLERRGPARLRAMAREMALAAEAGRPVSSAMAAHARLLYPWHLGVIRAAEVGAFLPEAFEQIARAYETEWETRSALRLRMFVYTGLGVPAILLSAPAILMLAQPIPPDGWTPGLAIAAIVHYLKTVSLPIALGLAGLALVWQVLQSTAWFQGVQQRLVIRLPVVGGVARAAALDRYLATLGLMLRGGLPIAQAAEEAAWAAGNASISPRLLGLVPALRQGQPLSNLLAETRLFNADTLNMAATGEVSGALPDMLARGAGYYREENESKRRILLRLAGVMLGVVCLCGYGALIYLYLRTYFGFLFRVPEWMLEGLE
jgi:type II secretory pathway component PulF